MKPVFGVMFLPDAPINLDLYDVTFITSPAGQKIPCIRCSAVMETAFGFLQLVPVAGKNPLPSLLVPPSWVLYMLRAEDRTQMGFLPGAG